MRPIAESIASALETIEGIETSDISSLAYASSLFAINVMLPDIIPDEVAFEVSVIDDKRLAIELEEIPATVEIRSAIDAIATDYFQSVRLSLPLRVH